MRAVQKFDPEKEIRLISYAVWWIRAYIQNYILRSWSLVKLGTTQAQRKLFFSLARTRRELDRMSVGHGADSDGEDTGKIARKLHVKASEVQEMAQRMDGRDLSLDAPLGEDGSSSHVDFVTGEGPGQDDELGAAQEQRVVSGRVGAALARLDERERFIIEQRVMNDAPMTLKELGDHFGFSRERARQLEIRAKEKLKAELGALAEEIQWPMGTPVDLDDRAVAGRFPPGVRRPGRRVARASSVWKAQSCTRMPGSFADLRHAVLLEPVPQRVARHAEQPRRLRLVAAAPLHRLGDQLPLHLVEDQPLLLDRRHHGGLGAGRGGPAQLRGQVLGPDLVRAGVQDEGPLDDVAQLAHVARPAVGLEQLHGRRRDPAHRFSLVEAGDGSGPPGWASSWWSRIRTTSRTTLSREEVGPEAPLADPLLRSTLVAACARRS
jgi:RNA polymerase sigma-32 factor